MADVIFRRGVEANLPTAGMATEGCVYHSTDTGNIYVGSSQGTLIPVNRSPYYGTCPTQSGTNAKVVTLDVDEDNFTMKAGVMISVLFSNANTAASPTLNVNGKGAVSVKAYGATNVSASPRAWEAGEVVTFVHNGTHWVMVGHKVQSDWNQTDTAAEDFIKNKPTNVSAFTNDAGYITTNDIPEGAAASTTTPKMDGVAEIGTELAFARGDHRHPSDTNKQNKLIAGKDIEIQDIVEVEYLESTGTQYINTGIVVVDTDKIFADAMFLSKSGDNMLFGVSGNTGEGGICVENYNNSTYYVRFGSTSPVSASTSALNQRHNFELRKNYFGVDGVQTHNPSYSSMPSKSLWVFSRNNSLTGVVRVYGFEIKNVSNDDIISLIPVRVGQVGYMYDRVSGTLFGNDGTGEFILGPDVRALSLINVKGGLAHDSDVVHKTGDETVGGTKTFSNNVVLGTNANLHFGTGQDEGVYMEANTSSGGQQALTFASLDDDSAVRLENVATPTNNNDAANKQYVDNAVGNTYVSLNGVADTYGIQQQSLCAFAFTAYPSSMAMTSFTTSGGTGSKTPITDRWFPIGCKIYYHDSDTQFTGSFTSKKFYSTYNGVDARYSSVSGTNISLSSTKAVYLMVEVSENGFWKPYYKSGETNEIIVTDTISAGHFYIYLGRTIGSTGYMFQLEDNNPLYACVMDGSGTHLVDWATYNSSITPYLVKNIQLFPSSEYPIGSNPIIGNTGIYSRKTYLDGSYLEGVYKVTLQLHAWWDYPKGTLDTPQPLSVIVNHNTNDKITGGTFVIPVMDSPNDSNYKMGTVVVNLTGFVTFTSAQTINDYIEVKVQGAKGINLGGEHPLWGGNEGDVEYNDGLILERVDWYNPR